MICLEEFRHHSPSSRFVRTAFRVIGEMLFRFPLLLSLLYKYVNAVLVDRPDFVGNVIELIDTTIATPAVDVALRFLTLSEHFLASLPSTDLSRFVAYLPLVQRIVSEPSIDPSVRI